MTARDDYPRLAGYATPGYINEVPHQSDTGKEFAAALDEIDRLRAECKAWMNGVADAVEPLGYDREAACGPANLLPGLKTLAKLWEIVPDGWTREAAP